MIAVAKLKNNKEIFRDPAFRGKLDPDFLIDLYEEFILWRIRNPDGKSEFVRICPQLVANTSLTQFILFGS